jgi:hypothetical protein
MHRSNFQSSIRANFIYGDRVIENMKNGHNEDNFVNFMMGIIAAPIVLAWVGLALFLVIMSFRDPAMVQDIESYKSVLLIIGSPALVIIYKVLELWTAQQNSQIEQVRKGTFENGDHEDGEKKE